MSRKSTRNRTAVATAAFALAAVAALVMSVNAGLAENRNVAQAQYAPGLLGGRWHHLPGHELNLNYAYLGGHRYLGNVHRAALNWSNTPTRINIAQETPLSSFRYLRILDVSVRDAWVGMAVFPDGCTTCFYNRTLTIFLNQRLVDTLNDHWRTKVATHEFGHTLGLAHPPASARSVMKQGQLSFNTPQTWDVNLINTIYP